MKDNSHKALRAASKKDLFKQKFIAWSIFFSLGSETT